MCPSPSPCLPAPGLLHFSYQTLKQTRLGTGKTECLPLESSSPGGGLVCAVLGSRGQAQGLQGQGARVPACLRAAQAWLMALSPMPGQLSACFQIKNAYSVGFQVSDPRKNTKLPTQIRKLRPCGCEEGPGTDLSSHLPGAEEGRPICLSFHASILKPLSTPDPSKCSPEPVPSHPLLGNVMKALFIILQLGQLFQMVPIR